MRLPTRRIALSAVLLLCAGGARVGLAASSPTNRQIRAAIERILEEEGGYEDLCAVSRMDLNQAGNEAVIFTFLAGVHGSQVRVLTWQGGAERLLFSGGSDTPNTDVVKVDGLPAIVLEHSTYEPSYVDGQRTQELSVWDGKAFTHQPADDCLLKEDTITEKGQQYRVSTAEHCLPKREPVASLACDLPSDSHEGGSEESPLPVQNPHP